MRALIGPLNADGHRPVVGPARDLDARCFDRAGADIAFDPAHEPLEALWSRLPTGWTPDCLIWWSPEYSLLPDGIERSPVPSIAVLGDWNLGTWTTAPLLEAFDWVVTDRRGVERLGPQLEVPVDQWPVFSFDPSVHRRITGSPRDIDVLFLGSMNHEVQVDRTRWLARLAALGDRRRVVLAQGIYGEAYAELMNRARIVWNRSIRGEMNMRAYEAPACGALLLMEAENREVRDVYAPGVSCALYDAASLERVIDDLLASADRTARIAEAGWRRVQAETYRAHLERLLARAATLRVGSRAFGRLAPWRRDFWLGLHALCAADRTRVRAAIAHLTRALDRAPARGPMAATLGAAATLAALDASPPEQSTWLSSAIALFTTGLVAEPGDVVTRMNLAWALAARGETARARTEWLTARERIAGGALFPVDRVVVPFGFDRFRTEWEGAALEPDLERRTASFRPLLSARVAAELAGADGDGHRDVGWWTESVQALPGIASNVRRRAEALEAAGDLAAARAGHLRALDANPFDWVARTRAATLAAQAGDRRALDRLLADGRRLAAAAPEYAGRMAALESLTAEPPRAPAPGGPVAVSAA